MDEQKRDCFTQLIFLVQKMHINVTMAFDTHCCLEVWQLIQFLLVCSPVESGLPMLIEALDVLLGATIVPSRAILKLSRPLVVIEPSLQSVKFLLRYVDLVWLDLRHVQNSLQTLLRSQDLPLVHFPAQNQIPSYRQLCLALAVSSLLSPQVGI